MAGKITIDQLMAALVDYQATHPDAKIDKVSEDSYMITESGSSAGVELKDGNLLCPRSQSIKDSLLGFILDCATGPKTALSPAGDRKMSTPERYGRKGQINGSALDIVKQCASNLDVTYSVGGKSAPTAKTVLTAAADAGISFEVRQYIHRQDYIEVIVRAHQGDRYDDAVVSIYKQDFINSRAWEMVGKQAARGNDILDLDMPYSENGMPSIKKDAMVTVKIKGGKDEIKTGFQKVNAQIWLYQELMQAWIFQGRQCVTKAKSKAASELLLGENPGAEIQEDGELADEMAEREMVERAVAA